MAYPRAPVSSMQFWPEPDTNQDHARDEAGSAGGMPLYALEAILEDQRNEAQWRREADICADYYDSNQLTNEVAKALEDVGLAPVFRNIIKPTVDAVLGLEERTRTDWKVLSDYDHFTQVAEALSVKLGEAERDTYADRAISDAYAMQVKTGFSAVEVSRNSNPFEHPYRVQPLHRREIFWDPRSRKVDWSDARYVRRKRWYDVDVACLYFPKHADLLRYAVHNWQHWAETDTILTNTEQMVTGTNWRQAERTTTIDDLEWRDSARKRVCIHEVWYRTWQRGKVLKTPDGRTVEFNMANPVHVALHAAGQAACIEAVYDKLRLAYFAGPHRIADFATTRRKFPYVPFWGFREDLTGAPYGLIRSMVSVQDEINTRLAKMLWLLKSRRTVIDSDAPDEGYNSLTDLSAEVGKADAFIVLDPARRNLQGAIQVDQNLDLAEAQRKALIDAIQAMPAVSGVYAPLLGQATGVTAAKAIEKLVDQGTTTLAEINGNYTHGRRLVGELLLDLVREDLDGKAGTAMVDTGVSKRQVYINRPMQDPATGMASLENNTSAAQVKVQLADVPNSQSYRKEQFAALAEITKSMAPELQAIITPFVIEASDLPKRKEIAKLLRDKLGVGADPETPEGQQAMAQAKEQEMAQAQQLAKQFDSELAEQAAKTEKLKAEAAKIRAEAQSMGGDPMKQIEFERRIMDAEAQYTAKLNQLTMDLLVTKAQAQLARDDAQAKAEIEESRQDNDIKRDEAKFAHEQELARINQASKKAEERIQSQMQQLSAELDEALQEFRDLIKETDAKTKDELKKRDEQAKVKEREDKIATTERERADKEVKAQQEKSEKAAKPEQAPIIVDATGKTGDAIAGALKASQAENTKALKAVTDAVAGMSKTVTQAISSMAKDEPDDDVEKEITVIDPVTKKTVTASVKVKRKKKGK